MKKPLIAHLLLLPLPTFMATEEITIKPEKVATYFAGHSQQQNNVTTQHKPLSEIEIIIDLEENLSDFETEKSNNHLLQKTSHCPSFSREEKLRLGCGVCMLSSMFITSIAILSTVIAFNL